MHARLTLVRATGSGLAQWRKMVTNRIAPNAANKPGFVQGFWFQRVGDSADDSADFGLAVTIWADRAALDVAESQAAANRSRLAEISGGTVETWNCELVAHSTGTDADGS